MNRATFYSLLALLALVAGAIVFRGLPGRARAAGAGAGIALRVANWGGPGVDPSFLKTDREVLADFERQHPGVRVQVENIPGPGQYVPKLLLTYVAGNPPDVIALDASSAAVFINHGLLADLTPVIAADPAFHLDDFFPNVVAIARREGRLFAVPLDFTPMVVIYNRRLFDEAHVPYPQPGWTRDQFLAAAKALTFTPAGAARPARYGFVLQKEMAMWFPWIWAGGGDVLSSDGRHAVGHLDGAPTRETLAFLIDLVRKHRVAPSLSESAAAGEDLFRAGKAAMTMTGHWSLIEYRVDHLDIGVASVPVAGGPAPPRVTVMYEAGLAISRASRYPDVAWAYVKHMTGDAVQKKRVATGLAISGNRRVAQSFAGNAVEDAFLEEVRYAQPPWGARVERYELVEDLGREMIEDLLGGVAVEPAVSRAAGLIEGELARP